MTDIASRALGADLPRIDGPAKVTGSAPYAFEHPVTRPAYAVPLVSTVARGRVAALDASAATDLPGVLAVLSHRGAPRLVDTGDGEHAVLQSADIHFRGQVVGAVVADSLEIARDAARRIVVTEVAEPHSVTLTAEHPELYTPEKVNPNSPADTSQGDAQAGLGSAPVTVDVTYRTPVEFAFPMEPHTTVARWHDGTLTVQESTQSVHGTRTALSTLFGLDEDRVTITAPYVGGGFGSKGLVHAPTILTVMCAMTLPGRAVKLALTRPQMSTLGGHRTPTIQRVQLGAQRDGVLVAVAHDVWEHTSRRKEFAEQTGTAARMMYASPSIRTSHLLAPLDVPVPTWMRAPGEAPGMYALESAMDELAVALGVDPVELRIRNEPAVDPESGKPWSSRNLVACLREGARRFGWEDRDPAPGVRRDGRWLVGTGVASSTYPRYARPNSQAQIETLPEGRYAVRIGAMDVGTGTWTALTQLAAEALEVDADRVALEIGDTRLPFSHVPGGSAGITSWGMTLDGAVRAFRAEHGDDPAPGTTTTAGVPQDAEDPADRYSMHAFGAHFAEVRVDVDTGEVRVPRMLGVFAAGRIVNPRMARSQLIGGMTFGLSMALHEEGVIDDALGGFVGNDLAGYHIAAHADVMDLDARWIDEHDPHVGPFGTKGIGEIGIVGAAAAIGAAVFHATGVRIRDLPLTPDKVLAALESGREP
jgi:xanthine dehydrogenase YagR molybdenum-binding subunit